MAVLGRLINVKFQISNFNWPRGPGYGTDRQAPLANRNLGGGRRQLKTAARPWLGGLPHLQTAPATAIGQGWGPATAPIGGPQPWPIEI